MNELHQHAKIVVDMIKETKHLYQLSRVDYYEFRNRWLALFNYGNLEGHAPLGEWVQEVCRGNAFMEVEVVKDGQKVPDELHPGQYTIRGGKVMFTVPPILNRNIEVKLEGDKSIDNVVITAQRKREVVAAAGENYYKQAVAGLIVEVPVDPKLFERMNDVFEHFGVKRNLPNSSNNTTTPIHTTEDKPEEKIDNDLLDFSF